ncbi:MAG: hypothetical protein KZQ66_04625 [Candidatus Thiodiazotropha sp. (ex Lucinoma aequizonata)]|nr:hypothetical protein [Candidatus Thiodiazotropha sp. (ex Lucinoma aequizonata)]MCU7910405.1 hypothetical protein [Candidatus Thiodiazotropha sp. (ex Lucinoma aequizonata)]MCU7913615.1 hypothetical protein [Candidatus Thiodiazotropha sp. (ex Lucinoma aequizonata)]
MTVNLEKEKTNIDVVPHATTSETLTGAFKNKWVIVRSRNEGVNFGRMAYADENTVIIILARRLWFYRPEDTDQSWYEGVANSGASADSKLSPSVDMKAIVEPYSLTLCTTKASENLQNHPSHKQTK